MDTLTTAGPSNQDDQSIDLREYVRVALRSWWIFLLFVIGGAVGATVINEVSTPHYTSVARILVQGNSSPGSVTGSDIQSSRTVADSFVRLVTTRPVIEEAIARTGDSRVERKIDVGSDGNLLEIAATDPEPGHAAAIANAVTDAFISDFQRRQFTQIAQFQAALTQYEVVLDPALVAAQASTLTMLSVVEPAQPVGSPSSPRKLFNLISGIAVGLLLGFVFVVIREYYDDRIKTVDELRKVTGFTTFGTVPYRNRFDRVLVSQANGGPKRLRDQHISEAYKFIQTSMQFAGREMGGASSFLITSSGPSEGKSTTAANLAASIASEGKSVLLVDADLRKPTLRHRFGLEDHVGLTELVHGAAPLEEVIVPTAIPNLSLIPAGHLPPDPPAMLRSQQFADALERVSQSADLTLLDAAPILAVTDPILIAAKVDGVILVVDVRATRRAAVARAAQLLAQTNPKLVGGVLNKAKSVDAGSYYYRYGYGMEPSSNGSLVGRLRRGLRFSR